MACRDNGRIKNGTKKREVVMTQSWEIVILCGYSLRLITPVCCSEAVMAADADADADADAVAAATGII